MTTCPFVDPPDPGDVTAAVLGGLILQGFNDLAEVVQHVLRLFGVG